MSRFENLPIAAKVTLPVILVGGMAVMIAIYALVSMYAIDRDYRALLDQDAAVILELFDSQQLELKSAAERRYQIASAEIENRATSTLIVNVIAVITALILLVSLSLYLSVFYISKPIKKLTQTMKGLNNGDLQEIIQHTDQCDEIGEMARALKKFRDDLKKIDHLRRKALESEQARQLAERTAEAKSAVLTAISHEIRTPLNAIIVLLGLVLKDSQTGSARDRLKRAETAALYLRNVVNDVLDLSRIDSGYLNIEKVSFDPRKLLSDIEIIFLDQARLKGLKLLVDNSGHLPFLIGDPVRISQILINYIGNAIKFCEKGEISVGMSLHYGNGAYRLKGWVKDQGNGLSPSEIELLFQPFWQGGNLAANRVTGSGLGLSICRRLAQLMGGEVWVDSEPGSGSCFWFEINVELLGDEQEPCLLAVKERRPCLLDTLNRLRVLIVDDNEPNLMVVQELLAESGVQVDTARSGSDALKRLESSADDYYSAVLMDVMMAGLDGIETTRMIRAKPRFERLPIIALTAFSDPEIVAQCQEAGISQYVTKPLDEDVLLEALVRCLTEGGRQVDGSVLCPATSKKKNDEAFQVALDVTKLNTQPLVSLRQRVTYDRFLQICQILSTECQRLATLMQQSASVGDNKALQRHAHDLSSAAGHCGMLHVVEVARALLRAVKENDSVGIAMLASQLGVVLHEGVRTLEMYCEVDRGWTNNSH